MKSLITILFCSFLMTVSCVTTPEYSQYASENPDHVYEATGKNGMVSAAHPLASKAGVLMLKKGGNAVDAAIATSFAISVLRPQSTGLGGGGFSLVYNAGKLKSKKGTKVFDFRERAPLLAKKKMYINNKGEPISFSYRGTDVGDASVNGHLSVGVPGLVAGLLEMHRQYGSLPLKVVMQPAIDLARNGFPVYSGFISSIESREKLLSTFESSKVLYLPNGKPPIKNTIFKNADLARTLERIAQNGIDEFYKGKTADLIIEEMERGKGLISKDDLLKYTVKFPKAVSGTYRGYKIVSMPPPSSGGVHIIEMLNLLEPYDLSSFGQNSPKSLHLLAESMRIAFADRAKYLGDPEFVKVPTSGLISKKYARSLAPQINIKKAGNSNKMGPSKPFDYESDSTTHLSVVDKWGNAVSSTQTVNYTFGSGVVVKGAGFILNDEMDDFSKKPGFPNAYGLIGSEANAIAARKTMLSSMSPTIVFDSNENVKLVVGSPGGPRIITATLQTILNVIDFKMKLLPAVHASRIHHQWKPDKIRVEKDELPDETLDELRKMGHVIDEGSSIGDVQAIIKTGGIWRGVSDRRSSGSPAGY